MTDFVDRYCVRKKGPMEPLMPRREPSPERDAKSEPEDAFVDREKHPRMPVHKIFLGSGAVEEVELSPTSDNPVVANAAEISLEYQTDPLRPFTSYRLSSEEFELSEGADSMVEKAESLSFLNADEEEIERGRPFVFRKTELLTTSRQRPEAVEVEEKLNKALFEGGFDAIKGEVTPKNLARCKSNTLIKSFEVNERLRKLAKDENPEKDDLKKLKKSMDEFTSALIDPLKADADTRNTFKSCFDYVVETAIDKKQKKFISHPVVYNLVRSRWFRSFFSATKESWRKPERWVYFFLNLWTVFDIFLFPFLFAIFFIVHLFKQALRRRRGIEMCFVLRLAEDKSEKEFNLIKGTMSHIVKKFGFRFANYCVVLHEENELIGNIKFGQRCSISMIEELKKPSSRDLTSLYTDLSATCDAFRSLNSYFHEKAKKVVVLFLDDSLKYFVSKIDVLKPKLEELQKMQVNVFPVGIGEHAKLSELEQIRTPDGTASHFGEYESPETLGTAVIQAIEGEDIYEKYKDYFTTPHFIFFRDTLSYLTLLGLHFAICLSPSTVSFSQLEWVILVFFLGRILMEVDQFISAKKKGVKARKMSKKGSNGPNYKGCLSEDQPKKKKKGYGNILLKKFTIYFSDRSNALDFIIDVLYLISFILRIITWRISTDVSNNRLLAVSEYFYGFIAMFLTLRAFGLVMECVQGMGVIQIALFSFMWDVVVIFWQFMATILGFSLAMTKIYVAEKAYTSGKDSAEDLACSESGIICWWNMATHLGWSLLSLADKDKLNSVDNLSVSMIHLLYSFFLIVAVILLVNMMIALLSNTYQKVQDNSLQEWSFERAITVRTYSSYHPIPVPFNLLSIPVRVFWRTHFDSPALDEEGRSGTLDNLVNNLQKTYFQKYGYKFPHIDKKKIDYLVQENEGSRKMTNQIVWQVFQLHGIKEDKRTFGQGAWYDSQGIAVDGGLLTYLGPEFCHKCKKNGSDNPHSAKFNPPYTPETPRLEVLIQETGERRLIGLGVVHEDSDHHSFPGWFAGTVGYHVDDGKIFEGRSYGGREVEGAMAYRGDLIACEVDFKEVQDGRIPVLFFLNGKEVARSSLKYTSGQKLIPSVTLGSKGITVLTKMCHRDGDPSSRVTNEDLQEKIDLLQKQIAELKKLFLDSMEVKEKKEPTSL